MKKFLPIFSLLPLWLSAQNIFHYNLLIQNDTGDWLPFRMSISVQNNQEILHVRNASESITLEPVRESGDSVFYRFTDYNAEIALVGNGRERTGYWINYDSEKPVRRSLKTSLRKETLITSLPKNDIGGKWKVEVKLPTRSYQAVFEFNQVGNKLYGTMRTRAGDYRYLEGEINGEEFYLSSFQGSMIFQLKGKVQDEKLTGKILSTTSNSTTFQAVLDESFELPDTRSITKLKNEQPFNLNLKDENGVWQNFDSLTNNKVTIVSIFGTWCPNCVDEIDYFQELQEKFPEVQIIAVAFETPAGESERQKRVRNFKQRKGISTTFLIGGKLGKESVANKFPMIDHTGIYPTSFLVDKSGKIREIYTGFNGPATGILFEKFKEEFEEYIHGLLEE